jgi:hypothetical protein
MTGEAVAVGAGVSALGAGVGAYANNQALKKQDAAAAAGLMRQRALQGQANADVQQGVIKTATNNNANLAKNREAEQEQYAAALQRAQPVQSGSISGAPGGSKRYAADVMAARSGVADYGAKLGASTAAIDAPSLTNMQTQEALGDTAEARPARRHVQQREQPHEDERQLDPGEPVGAGRRAGAHGCRAGLHCAQLRREEKPGWTVVRPRPRLRQRRSVLTVQRISHA